MKNCPYCSCPPIDHYVYFECPKCGIRGPWQNGGRNDDHVDYRDHEIALENWNKMVTSISRKK